jgi:hypothetical protein
MSLEKKRFGAERVLVDNGVFKDCLFEGSTLVYFGGVIPHMENCDMRGVKFEFGGPAKNTVDLLGWLRSQNMIA